MKRTALLAFVLGGSLTLIPNVHGQKKPVLDVYPADAKAYTMLAQHKQIEGVVQSTTADGIILRIEYTRQVADPKAVQAASQPSDTAVRKLQKRIADLQADQIALAKSKSPASAQKRMNEINRDIQAIREQMARMQADQLEAQAKAAKSVKTDTDLIDFDLRILPKSPIRKLGGSAMETDDKASRKDKDDAPAPKKDTLIGSPAEMNEVSPGAKVKVFLVAGKGPMGAVVKKKDESGAIVEVAPANRPQIRMVVILEAAPVAKRKK